MMQRLKIVRTLCRLAALLFLVCATSLSAAQKINTSYISVSPGSSTVLWVANDGQNGVYTSTKLTRENPDLVRRYLRAYVEAIHFYKTRKEETLKIMRKYSRVEDRKVLEETWDWHVRYIPEAPYPPADGYQMILQDMAATNPKAAQSNAKDFVELRFVKELDDSGFIKSLYKR